MPETYTLDQVFKMPYQRLGQLLYQNRELEIKVVGSNKPYALVMQGHDIFFEVLKEGYENEGDATIVNRFNRPKYGAWKLHLSVDSKDMSKAAHIIFKMCAKENMLSKATAFSGLAERNKGDNSSFQGRLITLYLPDDRPHNKIVNYIEKEFKANNIKPGKEVVTNRKVGQFSYYRYGKTAGADYVKAIAGEHKPEGVKENPTLGKMADEYKKQNPNEKLYYDEARKKLQKSGAIRAPRIESTPLSFLRMTPYDTLDYMIKERAAAYDDFIFKKDESNKYINIQNVNSKDDIKTLLNRGAYEVTVHIGNTDHITKFLSKGIEKIDSIGGIKGYRLPASKFYDDFVNNPNNQSTYGASFSIIVDNPDKLKEISKTVTNICNQEKIKVGQGRPSKAGGNHFISMVYRKNGFKPTFKTPIPKHLDKNPVLLAQKQANRTSAITNHQDRVQTFSSTTPVRKQPSVTDGSRQQVFSSSQSLSSSDSIDRLFDFTLNEKKQKKSNKESKTSTLADKSAFTTSNAGNRSSIDTLFDKMDIAEGRKSDPLRSSSDGDKFIRISPGDNPLFEENKRKASVSAQSNTSYTKQDLDNAYKSYGLSSDEFKISSSTIADIDNERIVFDKIADDWEKSSSSQKMANSASKAAGSSYASSSFGTSTIVDAPKNQNSSSVANKPAGGRGSYGKAIASVFGPRIAPIISGPGVGDVIEGTIEYGQDWSRHAGGLKNASQQWLNAARARAPNVMAKAETVCIFLQKNSKKIMTAITGSSYYLGAKQAFTAVKTGIADKLVIPMRELISRQWAALVAESGATVACIYVVLVGWLVVGVGVAFSKILKLISEPPVRNTVKSRVYFNKEGKLTVEYPSVDGARPGRPYDIPPDVVHETINAYEYVYGKEIRAKYIQQSKQINVNVNNIVTNRPLSKKEYERFVQIAQYIAFHKKHRIGKNKKLTQPDFKNQQLEKETIFLNDLSYKLNYSILNLNTAVKPFYKMINMEPVLFSDELSSEYYKDEYFNALSSTKNCAYRILKIYFYRKKLVINMKNSFKTLYNSVGKSDGDSRKHLKKTYEILKKNISKSQIINKDISQVVKTIKKIQKSFRKNIRYYLKEKDISSVKKKEIKRSKGKAISAANKLIDVLNSISNEYVIFTVKEYIDIYELIPFAKKISKKKHHDILECYKKLNPKYKRVEEAVKTVKTDHKNYFKQLKKIEKQREHHFRMVKNKVQQYAKGKAEHYRSLVF